MQSVRLPKRMLFTDAAGRTWEVIDYRVDGRKKKRVPLESWKADGRAFVPQGFESPVLVHAFGHIAQRGTDARNLENLLHFAKPSTANARERMEPPPPSNSSSPSSE